MKFEEFVSAHQTRIVSILETYLPTKQVEPSKLHEAMRYSIFNGGKRVRPLLIYAVGQTFNCPVTLLDAPAAAVEMIHCYSLIHDDLPAMDNDDLRRGLPTCHKAFDEATAILAGDALQALAFEVLANETRIEAMRLVRMIKVLADACGPAGMAGGQALDIDATGQQFSADYVEMMHRKKTGALITASIYLAGLASHCSEQELLILKSYGEHIGLAFQIQDDILDIEGSTEQLGKQQGADLAADKLTYPQAVGLAVAKQKALELYNQALAYLQQLNRPITLLEQMSRYIVQREF